MKEAWSVRSAIDTCWEILEAGGEKIEAESVRELFLERFADSFEENLRELAKVGLSTCIQSSFHSRRAKAEAHPVANQFVLQFGISGELPDKLAIPPDENDIMGSHREWKNLADCRIREARLSIIYKRAQAAADIRAANVLQTLVDKALLVEGITEESTLEEAFFASGGSLKTEVQ